MKKFICFLTAAIMLVSLWSCGAPAEEVDSSNSASGEFVLTKDMVSNMLTETKNEAVSSSRSTLSTEKQTLPDFMSLERVQALTKKQDFSYKSMLRNYENTVFQNFEDLISELPERCVIDNGPFWNRNTDSEVTKYVVLDPENVPMDTTELGAYLDWKYLETRYAEYDRNYAQYYDFDMESLEEKYADIIGTVLVDRSGAWFYLEPASGSLERIDFFPDYYEIKLESFRPINEQIEEFTAMVNEIKANQANN